jgi:phage tail-like protein
MSSSLSPELWQLLLKNSSSQRRFVDVTFTEQNYAVGPVLRQIKPAEEEDLLSMSNLTRREFLTRTLLGAVGGGIAFSVLRPEDLTGMVAAQRGYTAGRFALDIGGVPAGWLYSAEGGHATSDVVSGKIGGVDRQRPGNVRYEPITIECGVGMSRPFYEWIVESIGMNRTRDGAIHVCDYDGNVKSTLEFHNAAITEIGLPALDAASKEQAKMTIKFAPEFTRTLTGSGKKVPLGNVDAAKQKRWVSSNFRLEIGGVDCTRVSRIDAITIQPAAGAPRGGPRAGYDKGPATVEVPNLIATVEESHSADFANWMNSSSRNPNSPSNKKSGQLDFLSADGREALFTLHFPNLSIRRLTPENGKGRNVVKVEMYFQALQFHYSAV